MKVSRSDKYQNSDEVGNILLGVALIVGFIFLVSLAIYVIKERYGLSCRCSISLPFVIAVLSSLGLFVGILTYYIFSKSFSKEKESILGNVEKTLDFLDLEEKSILLALIDNEGEIAQNKLSSITKIDSVKLHRRISNLTAKGILKKDKVGMTNKISLDKDLMDVFIK